MSTAHTSPSGMVTNIRMYLTVDDEPIFSSTLAVELAKSTGFCILPRKLDNGDGMWLCDIDPALHVTLVTTGWVGVENGPFAAEAELD
jgi:hypothetical protein